MKQDAITTLEHAGKYLMESRDLRQFQGSRATDAAHSDNADLQSLAVMSVLLARVVHAQDDGWVAEICRALGLAVIRD